MSAQAHYKSLENMYLAAPINGFFPPEINIGEGQATVSLPVRPDYFHTAGSLHGSVYFKLLDDSAFFAANSLRDDVFVFTVEFTTTLKKPVTGGVITATGQVDKVDGRKIFASSTIRDEGGDIVAKGKGLFLPSRNKLLDIPAYKPD